MKGKKGINIVVVAILILIFIKSAMLLGEYKSVKKEEPALVVRLNLEGDFPNPNEGTALFNMRLLMDQIILQAKKVPKYVIFTESRIIPGLFFRYNVHDSVFEGGLPSMKSAEVIFLDGNMHEIAYTFKKGSYQKIYFDGKEIASGKFDPSKIGITGFAVSDIQGYETATISIDGTAEMLGKAR